MPQKNTSFSCKIFALALLSFVPAHAYAALNIPITVNMSEAVNVTGTPRIAVDVGGTTRYATYTSGTGTNALTFTLSPQTGDVDLDGVTVSSPIDLNGGTIKDTKGNTLASLAFTPPNTANVKVNYPSLGMDFIYDADGRYSINGTVYNDLTSFLSAAGGSFTRASVGTYFDSSDTMQTATSGTPRFDYDPTTHVAKGILIEESRKNSLRNSMMAGTVAGTPGTLPTYWGPGGAGLGTLTQQIIGTGTENGMTYIDIKISGTASTASFVYYMENTNYVAATSGQTWTGSVYTKLVAGSTANISSRFDIYERNSGGGSLINSQTNLSMTGTLTRTTLSRTFNNASTAYTVCDVSFYLTVGQPVNMTIRIAAPQLEQGSFATSYIPTTNATVTRALDSLSIPSGAWGNATTGTFYVEAPKSLNQGVSSRYYAFINGNAQVSLINGTNVGGYVTDSSGTSIASFNSAALTTGTTFKDALAYTDNDFSEVVNGGTPMTDTSGTMSSLSTLVIGNNSGGGTRSINSSISKLKYYPVRVPNAQSQLLTQ